MRTLLLYFLLLVSFPIKANTSDPWSKQDILLETIYQVTLYIDWKQTSTFHKYTLDRVMPKFDAYGHQIIYPPNMYMIKEMNPFLPAFPKQRTINAACLGAAVGHVMITNYLSADKRIYWQGVTVGAELVMIYNNVAIGVRIDW